MECLGNQMKTLNNGTQTLNFHYRQELAPDVMNKIFYKLFTPGVISATFSFSTKSVTIESASFLIRPQNQADLLVRVDTTEAVEKIKTSPTNIYLTARFRWESENTGVEFLFADDSTIVETDVILIGLTLDEDGNITSLDYDVQEWARIKVIQKDTNFPLVYKLDGYAVGNSSGYIPLSNGTVNTSLNAQFLNGKEITDLVVSKDLPTLVTEGESEVIIFPTIPSWMDSNLVDLGEGVTAEFVTDKKVQPQDGVTLPGIQNQIPVANTVLQKDLNAQYLNGYLESDFAKTTHSHTLDDILDAGWISAPDYRRIVAVKANLVSADSIEDDDITYTQAGLLAYDVANSYWYKPIYETGSVSLTGVAESTVTFQRSMNNVRVYLQRAPAAGEGAIAAGLEKRTARVTTITTANFKCKQMGSILKVAANYIRDDSADAGANQYFYIVVGEAI